MSASQAAVVGDHRLVAQHHPVVEAGAAADVAVPSDNRSANGGLLADAGVRPDNCTLDGCVFLEVTVPSDHAVGTDSCARLDHRALVDEARRGKLDAFFD